MDIRQALRALFGLGLVALISASSPTWAADPRIEISGLVGVQFGGETDLNFPTGLKAGEASLESSEAYGATLGLRVREGALAVISYYRQPTEVKFKPLDSSRDGQKIGVDVGYLQIGGELEQSLASHIKPFMGLTIGATHMNPDGGNTEWFFSGMLYAGAKFPFNEHVGIRMQMGLMGVLLDNDSQWLCVNSACLVQADVSGFIQGNFSVGVFVAF